MWYSHETENEETVVPRHESVERRCQQRYDRSSLQREPVLKQSRFLPKWFSRTLESKAWIHRTVLYIILLLI